MCRLLYHFSFIIFAIFLLTVVSPGCIFHPVVGYEKLQEYAGLTEDEELSSELMVLLAGLMLNNTTDSSDTPVPSNTPATKIVMFNAGTVANGDMSGLSGANSTCNAHANKPTGTTAVAFLSSDSQDLSSLSDVPTTLPVVGPTDIQIATNWAYLFTTDIDTTLFAAGILPTSSEFFSGTDSSGNNYSAFNCTNWNSSTGDSSFGDADMNSGWIDAGDPTNQCTNSLYLLCVAW